MLFTFVKVRVAGFRTEIWRFFNLKNRSLAAVEQAGKLELFLLLGTVNKTLEKQALNGI